MILQKHDHFDAYQFENLNKHTLFLTIYSITVPTLALNLILFRWILNSFL